MDEEGCKPERIYETRICYYSRWPPSSLIVWRFIQRRCFCPGELCGLKLFKTAAIMNLCQCPRTRNADVERDNRAARSDFFFLQQTILKNSE